ncbi:MAG TPA: hypothetical protein VN936_05160 [Candidatus Acidoferrum sp.]|jgi:hypothetical protein|nr:hypothetical protein [Candidatus Acidoferrum sp.]
MNIPKLASTIAAVAGLSFLSSTIPAMATTNSVPAIPTPYVAAFTPAFGLTSLPYAGQMQLTMSDGTVTGTYTGISVRPDPLNGRIIPVTGTVSSDGHVQFYVGNAMSFTGEVYADGTISGSADYRGQIWDFMAKPGLLR